MIILCLIVIIIISIFLANNQRGFFYGALVWLLLCIYIIITDLQVADIEIFGDTLLLKKIFSQTELNLSELKIYNITIRRHPLFFIETSVGNFRINYTKNNYCQILELLRKNQFSGLELFETKVKRYFLSPYEGNAEVTDTK
jgi:hypothetical protein